MSILSVEIAEAFSSPIGRISNLQEGLSDNGFPQKIIERRIIKLTARKRNDF